MPCSSLLALRNHGPRLKRNGAQLRDKALIWPSDCGWLPACGCRSPISQGCLAGSFGNPEPLVFWWAMKQLDCSAGPMVLLPDYDCAARTVMRLLLPDRRQSLPAAQLRQRDCYCELLPLGQVRRSPRTSMLVAGFLITFTVMPAKCVSEIRSHSGDFSILFTLVVAN